MRPLRLELKNFTAYREPQVIDFEDLDLFAITGPIGSGKSSLMDAMTFALYGKTPRVGNRTVQLIAQGQPALSVCLDFAVDRRRFRVVRTAGLKATSATIRLEEWREDQWQSYGDGADRIRDATRSIETLVGLDYEAFTRSVLLPQGQFQEFLVGDPAQRRSILTELLGLELFERMARRAGEVAREARSAAQAKDEVLSRQFAGVDADAVREARARARQAKARAAAMAEVERSLDGLAREFEGVERRIEALDELSAEARELVESAEGSVADLQGLLAEMQNAGSTVAAADQKAAHADSEVAATTAALTEAETAWGSVESIATLRGSLEHLAALDDKVAAAERSWEEAQKKIGARAAALDEARAESAEAAEAMEQAAASLAEAEGEHESAHREDLVGAPTRGKKVGDPCPVCHRPLEEVHKVDSRELTRVKKVLDRARDGARQAEARWSKVERDAALAEREVQVAVADSERIGGDLEAMRAERAAMVSTFEAAFGGDLPEHPIEEMDQRLAELRARRARLDAAESASRQAAADAVRARDVATDLEAKGARIVGALRGLSVPAVIRRARQSVPDLEVPPTLVGALPGEPGPALETARGMAEGLVFLVDTLASATKEARVSIDAIVERARSLLPEGMPKAMVTDVYDLLDAARTLAKDLGEEAVEAKGDAQRLGRQLKDREELQKEVETRSAEAAVFQALAGELRADRLITFLQGEALELLAAAGSERLLFLSQNRYRLAFDEDEFFVEDRQNGDERRSVRTLSGGETFLASLALALALSEQIQSLAVTERARLQSLFIDEGFGALDPESLEIATEALSQLGGQDRMVGVITHVSELAERLPVRIEVRKLPGGSRLEVVS
jgi:DNA repair protein SbcC/Rad50